ncbi:MAG: polyprenyl diphosphate synthase [Oscillospiraceae bacterium]|nr:polyprenyl diphosphate synthase [Oscillospiraceae bacterium]
MTLPQHIGIIMDGNRRWAKKRLLPAAMGHKKGAEVFRERVTDLAAIGVANVTFYALSTENLQRNEDEVKHLFRLFETQLYDLDRLTNEHDIRLSFIGDLSVFSDKLLRKMQSVEKDSGDNKGLTCRLALNYGGKAEIVRAANEIRLSGIVADESAFEGFLYTKGAPDVDLVIRTGGEKRLSNFLLWQAAYAELYFTDTLWCDFSKKELQSALDDYSGRNRRMGK